MFKKVLIVEERSKFRMLTCKKINRYVNILHNVLVVEVLGFFRQLVVSCKVMKIPNGPLCRSSH